MAVVLDLDFELHNLDGFTSTSDADGDMTVEHAAGLAGTAHGLQFVLDDNNAMYGRCTLTPTGITAWRARIYLDYNSMTGADTNTFNVFIIRATGFEDPLSFQFRYTTAAGWNYRITTYSDVDAATYGALSAITDEPHYVEILFQKSATASSNDGVCTMWVDGVEKYSKTDGDWYNNFAAISDCQLCATGVDTGTRGTFYLDQFILRNDATLIGPYAAAGGGVPKQAMYYARMRETA